ncbi:BMP family lipoprotein [Mesorhizobium sp.]|jgi:basic membrane protein A|uniref:BMP family lipoprotein n=1 Tax=Mesorhizobium sp. TaxID=1871066 RepID=UPI0039C91C0C
MMKFGKAAILALLTINASSAMSLAAGIKPAILYDLGGKFDRGFNESAYRGATRFKDETGVAFLEFEPNNDAQREQALQTFARQGADPIVTVGFTWEIAVQKIAPKFPKAHFVIVDSEVKLPNVQSVEFAYNEGAFMVGALAGMTTKTNKLGFVGGMDIPLIRDYECAYRHGARHTNAQAEVIANMTGTTPAAWSDPARGRELALGQYDRGADIVFAAAGGTTLGVLQAAADAGKLAIGVDSNQNGIQPGHVLTSAMSATDVAVYLALKDAADGKWQAGAKHLGLKEGAVSWALDDHNRPLLTAKEITKMEEIKNEVISGKIAVPDFVATGNCPAL